MAGSVNKVTLVGRLGKDPESRNFQNGGMVCNLSLATSESWKDKATGERKEHTEWHRVCIFNEHIAKIAQQYLHKGDMIYIEGQVKTRKYEKDGKDVYTTEIVLAKFSGELQILASSKPATGEGAAIAGSATAATTTQKPAMPDDEIPF